MPRTAQINEAAAAAITAETLENVLANVTATRRQMGDIARNGFTVGEGDDARPATPAEVLVKVRQLQGQSYTLMGDVLKGKLDPVTLEKPAAEESEDEDAD